MYCIVVLMTRRDWNDKRVEVELWLRVKQWILVCLSERRLFECLSEMINALQKFYYY